MALTPPPDPQTMQKIDPIAGEGSGNKVANAIAAKLPIVTTNPTLRRCGAGATVGFIRGIQGLWQTYVVPPFSLRHKEIQLRER